MKPYKIKHKASGLYYQPLSNGDNLSKNGKIYLTKRVNHVQGQHPTQVRGKRNINKKEDKNEAITSKFLVFGTKTKYIVTLKNTTTGEVFTTDIDEREFYTWEVGYTFRRQWYSEEEKLRNKN